MLIPLSFAFFALGVLPQSTRDTLTLSSPVCRSCRLVRSTSVAIRDDRLVQQANGVSVAVRRDGAIVIGDVDRPDPVVLLVRGDEHRVLASGGDGPGELRRITAVNLDPLDSLFVFDAGSAKVSVFAPDGRFVRRVPIPTSTTAAAFLADHRLLLVQMSAAPRTAGHILLAMRTDGRPEALWREEHPQYGPLVMRSNRRFVIGLPDSSAFALHRFRDPVLEQRTATGDVRRVWRRSSPLLPPSAPGDRVVVTPTHPPDWAGMGIGRLNDSLIVVVWAIPDPHWANGLGSKRPAEGGGDAYPIIDFDKTYDTLVDLIDWRSGALIASSRFDEYYTGVTADGRLVLNRIDPEAQTELVTLRPILR
jgi:hypothetical protein